MILTHEAARAERKQLAKYARFHGWRTDRKSVV